MPPEYSKSRLFSSWLLKSRFLIVFIRNPPATAVLVFKIGRTTPSTLTLYSHPPPTGKAPPSRFEYQSGVPGGNINPNCPY